LKKKEEKMRRKITILLFLIGIFVMLQGHAVLSFSGGELDKVGNLVFIGLIAGGFVVLISGLFSISPGKDKETRVSLLLGGFTYLSSTGFTIAGLLFVLSRANLFPVLLFSVCLLASFVMQVRTEEEGLKNLLLTGGDCLFNTIVILLLAFL
jgi:uncharacterized membrane protein